MVGAGEDEGGAIVGLGVAGVSVGDGDGDGVGAVVGAVVSDRDGDAVEDGMFVIEVPEAVGLRLAAGAAHAATRATTKSATTGRRRNMSRPPNGKFTHH